MTPPSNASTTISGSESSLQVALVAPEIPWNTGNVGRTCDATGTRLHLVRPLGFSLHERRLRRAGLDYWQRLAPTVWPTIDAFTAALPTLGAPLFFSTEGTRSLWDVDLSGPRVLIFGSESAGLPASVRDENRQHMVSIPMAGPARSLNLSTAVAVVIYEALRQRASASSEAV